MLYLLLSYVLSDVHVLVVFAVAVAVTAAAVVIFASCVIVFRPLSYCCF